MAKCLLLVEDVDGPASRCLYVESAANSSPRIAQIKCKFLTLALREYLALTTCSKHERKHTKPFKCRHAECMAKDVGFSTENDRDRHYKSGRHHEAPTKGALKGFICVACTDGKVKWWPRQDNFKAHCTRRHTEWDTKELMKQFVQLSICRRSITNSEPDRSALSDRQPHTPKTTTRSLPTQATNSRLSRSTTSSSAATTQFRLAKVRSSCS